MMRIIDTDNSNMSMIKISGFKITPLNRVDFEMSPPSSRTDLYPPSLHTEIDSETHNNLLCESLEIYDDIWTTLAQM